MNYAPIALFVYNRPQHTQDTVEALLKNPECAQSDLYIFSDASKSEDTRPAVNDVREYIRQISGFKTITIIERDKNLGLANSIIDGVSYLCSKFGKVIVLEDDLLVSKFFLKYMNDSLNLYECDDSVASISGYFYPITLKSSNDTLLTSFPSSWGWATWYRAWSIFDKDPIRLLKRLEQHNITKSFDQNGPPGCLKMLKDLIHKKNNSWYIRWYASIYLESKKVVFPTQSLVLNMGIDGSGVHCSKWFFDPFKTQLLEKEVLVTATTYDKKIYIKPLKQFFIKVLFFRYINAILRKVILN